MASIEDRIETLAKAKQKLIDIGKQAKSALDLRTEPYLVERGATRIIEAPSTDLFHGNTKLLRKAIKINRRLFDAFTNHSDFASIPPYGQFVRLKDHYSDPVDYGDAFYVLPDDLDEVEGFKVSVMPGGSYLAIGFKGYMAELAEAFQALVDYAAAHDIELEDPVYEIGNLSILDADISVDALYRCTILAQIKE